MYLQDFFLITRFVFSNFLFLTAQYFLIGGAFYFYLWKLGSEKLRDKKIQLDSNTKTDIKGEITYSVLFWFVVSTLLGFTEAFRFAGWNEYYYEPAKYGYFYLVFTFILFIFTHDTFQFWSHYLLHFKKPYKYIHYVHHKFRNPTPFASFAMHPLETIITSLAFVPIFFIIPVNHYVMIGYLVFLTLINVIAHCGYEIFPSGTAKYFVTSTQHNLHHSRNKGSFTLYFNFWDRIAGTNHKDYYEIFENLAGVKSREKRPGNGRRVFERTIDEFYNQRSIPHGGRNIMVSRAPGVGDVLLNDNDYLGLANDNRINIAQCEEIMRSGSGVQMSGIFLMERDHPQRDFETAIAEFLGFEDAILCQSGFDANVGLMHLVLNLYFKRLNYRPDVYMDIQTHMSLISGAKQTQSNLRMFYHNDPCSLEREIQKNYSPGKPGVIIIDSLYSGDGSIAPLVEISEIAHNYNFVLVVDESHSLGTHGPNGAGLCAEHKIKPDFITASLAKAFALNGGVVLCDKERYVFPYRSLSLPSVFSSSATPHTAARASKTLEIIQKEEWRRDKLHRNADFLRKGLRDIGIDIGDSQSQIISIICGEEKKAVALRDQLETEGVFVSLFVWPATSRNRALIRLSVNISHEPDDLRRVLDVFAKVTQEKSVQLI